MVLKGEREVSEVATHRLDWKLNLNFCFFSLQSFSLSLLRSFLVPLQRKLLTIAVAGAGEFLRETRREDCRRRSDFDKESLIDAVATPPRQVALAATAPGAARRGAALAE